MADFLLLPSDINYFSGMQRTGDEPAAWALFQIGDGSLPAIRAKTVNGDPRIRQAARQAAWRVLGPRSENELANWIAEAQTAVERERLAEARNEFQIVSANLQNKSVEQYRKETLAAGRARIKQISRFSALDEY